LKRRGCQLELKGKKGRILAIFRRFWQIRLKLNLFHNFPVRAVFELCGVFKSIVYYFVFAACQFRPDVDYEFAVVPVELFF